MANGNKTSRNGGSSRELLVILVKRLDAIEGRIAKMQSEQVLQSNELNRVVRTVTDLYRRCTERLGLACPMDTMDDDEEPATDPGRPLASRPIGEADE